MQPDNETLQAAASIASTSEEWCFEVHDSAWSLSFCEDYPSEPHSFYQAVYYVSHSSRRAPSALWRRPCGCYLHFRISPILHFFSARLPNYLKKTGRWQNLSGIMIHLPIYHIKETVLCGVLQRGPGRQTPKKGHRIIEARLLLFVQTKKLSTIKRKPQEKAFLIII